MDAGRTRAAERVTEKWILNSSDEKAVESGCQFNQKAAMHVVDWIESNLFLYEGDAAGQPFNLMPWQKSFLMRCFGWLKYSKDRQRWVRRFTKARLWCPKKNGKSPLAAAVGLYLLAGDNEQGQKVFSVARDGKQARIVHNHAIEMAQRSPYLSKRCKFRKIDGTILFKPLSASYSILSGENYRSQEGLNGSTIQDEMHVIPKRLTDVLEHMGASRAQPLDFGVSTYGNDPECQAKKDCDYGKAVEGGNVVDESFLHQSYELPEDATDSDMEDPATWKKCNPSLGVTIFESELKAACSRARRSLSDWNNFQMYRLNKWIASASPWIRSADWKQCESDFKLSQFYNQPVWLGLDLSKTRDMSSLCLIFKSEDDDPMFHVHPFFWLPEKYAKENNDKASFLEWEKSGHLDLIEGETIKQSFIRDKMEWIDSKFQVQGIAYDKTYAFDLITDHCEGNLGWDCVQFNQSIATYAGPVANFEELIVSGRLQHNDNPVFNWQAGHVQVKTGSYGGQIPVKPKHGDIRKIDGIVAAVMALSLSWYSEPQVKFDYYESNGVEFA
jgi:phage terminase large subunit-like protein